MLVKSLREKNNWSQLQLAQLSGLNIRTIQRVEKGESAGLETLKSLAAVFEIDVEQLKSENAKVPAAQQTDQELEHKTQAAKAEVQSKKGFFMLSLFLLGTFVLFILPNYNQGENADALLYTAICYAFIIGACAIAVFKPFGKRWEQKQLKQTLEKYDREGEL